MAVSGRCVRVPRGLDGRSVNTTPRPRAGGRDHRRDGPAVDSAAPAPERDLDRPRRREVLEGQATLAMPAQRPIGRIRCPGRRWHRWGPHGRAHLRDGADSCG